jgi:hypothetical protein
LLRFMIASISHCNSSHPAGIGSQEHTLPTNAAREPGVKPFDCSGLLIELEILIWPTYKSHLP